MRGMAEAVRRQGLVRGLALGLRFLVFPPDGPGEAFYRRWVRPWGRRLPRLARPGRLLGLTAWRAPSVPAIGSVLVLKLDHIGDFVLALPAFAVLRAGFAQARITLVCGAWNVALAEASGLFDAVVPFARFAARAEEAAPGADPAGLGGLGAFDLAVDLRVDPDTRPLLAGVRAGVTAGFAVEGGAALAISMPAPVGVHQRAAMVALASVVVASCEPHGAAVARVGRLAVAPADLGFARPLIGLGIGSGRAIKNWPLERFVALAERLRGLGGTVLLLGGADERGDADRVMAAMGGQGVVDRVGTGTVAEAFGWLAEVDLFIGNDSALGHASAALGRPTLVLFAGIDPLASWAPLGERAVAIKAEVSCAPCHLTELSQCPNGHLCMTGIPLAVVEREALRLLPGAGAGI